jgi:hypothetical protein
LNSFEAVSKVILSNCYLKLVRAPTKAVGSIAVTKLEPTDLPVGAAKEGLVRTVIYPY